MPPLIVLGIVAVYANRLSRTKDELVATGHNDYALLPEEQAKDLLHQDALQDPSVQEAKQKARQLMIKEAQKIMPNVEALETELITLIDKVISLKWPGGEG